MKFWVLEERDRFSREGDGSCFYETVGPTELGDPKIVCPACQAVCGPRIWLSPRNIRTSKPQCGDLILGVAFELVVSERFVRLYREAGLSGIVDFGPVEVTGRPGDSYFAARPNITFTLLDEVASGLVWKREPICQSCRIATIAKIERVIVEESTWDGTDIFVASGFYGRKIVTETFVNAVQRAHLTNFVFVPAEEFHKE